MTSPISDILRKAIEAQMDWDSYYEADTEEAEQAITALLEAAIGPLEPDEAPIHPQVYTEAQTADIVHLMKLSSNKTRLEIRQKLGIGGKQ